MTASIPYLFVPVFSWPGAPGGKLHAYQAGSSSTPQTTYAEDGVTPNLNPVTLDSTGSAIVRLDPTLAYHFILKDSTDTTTLWDADTYQSQYLSAVNTVDSGAISYVRTAAEIAAGVAPINYAKWPSPWKDISRFVTDNTGATDVSAQFANALAAEKNIVVPEGTYNLGTTGIVLPKSGMSFLGASRSGVIFNFTGAGIAFDGYSRNDLDIGRFTINTTHVAATGMRFGNGVQHIGLQQIVLNGDTTGSNSGTGILLQSGNPGAFSGNLLAQLLYTLGYKFGIKCTGIDATNTWTSISFLQSYILGRAGGIIAGSKGLWMDALTNGVGSDFLAGTIEGFDVGLQVDAGSSGLIYEGDLEGNNTQYTVGNTFSGRIKLHNTNGTEQSASCNGTANRWFQYQQLSGVFSLENRIGQRFLIYDNDGNEREWTLARGAESTSYISGTANPQVKFKIHMGTSGDNVGARNYLYLNGQKVHWDSQSPQTTALITGAVGDVCFNSAAAVGQPKGWTCTVAGTPGTWVSQGNL